MNKKEKINKFWESRVLKYKRNFEDYAAASKKTLNKPMNKKILKEFDEIFPELYEVRTSISLEDISGTTIKDVTKKVRFFIDQSLFKALQQKDQALIEKIEKMIQEDRFVGAPRALNNLIKIIKQDE